MLRDERKRKGLPTKLDGRGRMPLLAGRAKRPYRTRGLHRLVVTAAKLAGIDKPVSPHWLRHSFATWAIELQAREIDVQFLLGHSTPAMLRRYTATYDAEKAVQAHASFSPADRIGERMR